MRNLYSLSSYISYDYPLEINDTNRKICPLLKIKFLIKNQRKHCKFPLIMIYYLKCIKVTPYRSRTEYVFFVLVFRSVLDIYKSKFYNLGLFFSTNSKVHDKYNYT